MNTYLIIALVWVLSLGAVGFGGYRTGSKHAEDAAQAAQAVALAAQAKESRDNALIDMRAAAEAATARQQVQIQFRDRIVTVKEIINASPTNCPLPDGYRLRVNELIDSANSKAGSVTGDVPASPKTGDGKGG